MVDPLDQLGRLALPELEEVQVPQGVPEPQDLEEHKVPQGVPEPQAVVVQLDQRDRPGQQVHKDRVAQQVPLGRQEIRVPQ